MKIERACPAQFADDIFSVAGLPFSTLESIRTNPEFWVDIIKRRRQNAHQFSSRSGSQFHSLMQVVATPDPSELTGHLIGGCPSECAELVEGERRFWIVWPVLVRS
jgi:hypothetical protein